MIAGNIVFTIATLAFAFAPSIWVLVAARAAQGVANAGLLGRVDGVADRRTPRRSAAARWWAA